MLRKIIVLISVTLLITPHLALALVTYGYGQSPNQIRAAGNVYNTNNSYSNTNFYNPYSNYQNPYHSNSIYQDHSQYSQQVTDFNLKPQGYVSVYVNAPHSITNPYSSAGNVYNNNSPLHPYSDNSNKSPYTSFQNSYHPQSLWQSGKFSAVIYDNNGTFRGSLNAIPYHGESIVNPYSSSGNPYEKGPANPYLANPYNN